LLTSAAIWLSGTPCSGVHSRTTGIGVEVGGASVGVADGRGLAVGGWIGMLVAVGLGVAAACGVQATRLSPMHNPRLSPWLRAKWVIRERFIFLNFNRNAG
jgi:hypothetical protein